jgi:mono/diheme cytochrome c family protein
MKFPTGSKAAAAHCLAAAGAAILTVLGARAAPAADAAAGAELARRWCAACHLVAADQERVPTVAPPFATIAKKPAFDPKQLSQSLLAPHPQMPGRELSRDQAADIAAYIATLK